MQEDTPTSRAQFEQWMERRRVEETDAEALQVLRRGWCLGSESLRREMLLRMDGKLGDHHSGEFHRARGNRAYDQRSCQKWPKLWADPCYGLSRRHAWLSSCCPQAWGWLGGGLGVAISWLSTGFRVALLWLWVA
jgi:hypothetical protein